VVDAQPDALNPEDSTPPPDAGPAPPLCERWDVAGTLLCDDFDRVGNRVGGGASLDELLLRVDVDGDGVYPPEDNCPVDANPDQALTACEDADGDGLLDDDDGSPRTVDPRQRDGDADGQGDACDDDGAVVLLRRPSGPWLFDGATGRQRTVWSGDVPPAHLRPSPDGRSVLYARAGDVWRADLDGAAPSLVAQGAEPVGWLGADVLYVRGGALCRRSADPLDERCLWDGMNCPDLRARTSLGGQVLARWNEAVDSTAAAVGGVEIKLRNRVEARLAEAGHGVEELLEFKALSEGARHQLSFHDALAGLKHRHRGLAPICRTA